MKTILLAALVLTTFLFALAGCSAEESSSNQLSLADAPDSDQFEREGRELLQQPQPEATPSPAPQADADWIRTDSLAWSPAGDVKVEPSIPAQERIIVHTAYLSLVTDDVALTIGRVGDFGGPAWRLGGQLGALVP